MRSTYDAETHWRRYQKWFPAEWRCEGAAVPREEWWSWRGMEVHLDRFVAADSSTKVVLLHGGGGYGRLFAPVGVAARRHGYEVVAPDLPGYGLTVVPKKHRLKYQDWIDCICDLLDQERRRDDRPIVLFGGSMGGMLAYEIAARSGAVCGLAATCLLDTRDPAVRAAVARSAVLTRWAMPAADKASRLVDPLPVPMRAVAKVSRIANDRELARLCATDKHGAGNWMPLGFLRTFLNMAPAVEPERFDACPVLLAHPGADRWTDLALSLPFFERLSCPKHLTVLDNAGHLPVEQPGARQLERALLELLAAIDTGTSWPPPTHGGATA